MVTLRRRAAAFVIVRADAAHWGDAEYRDNIYRAIDLGVGGIGVFAGSLEQTSEMIAEVQKRSGNRLLIGADFEHGLAMRLEGGVAFPRAMALGKLDSSVTESIAGAIAKEARAVGVHWNWAPCADINNNRGNPIISIRSFGEDPKVVSDHAVAYVRGSQRNGIMACAKHAPGHGDTTVDSHLELPRIDADIETLATREFVPFKACIDAGVASVMMGHILLPHLDGDFPASLSSKIINGIVRTAWGFEGLITTDALDMRSITERFDAGTAAVTAITAGADCALMPLDPNMAVRALMMAVDDGIISEERISISEQRRVEAMSGCQTITSVPVSQAHHAQMALTAADAAIEYIGNANVLPLDRYTQIAALAFVDERDANTATTFFRYLAEATEVDVDLGYIDGMISERELSGLLEGVEHAECILFLFFGAAISYNGALPGIENIPSIIERLCGNKKRIIISCGSPYRISDLKSDLAINTFSDTIPSLAATVLRLIGRKPA